MKTFIEFGGRLKTRSALLPPCGPGAFPCPRGLLYVPRGGGGERCPSIGIDTGSRRGLDFHRASKTPYPGSFCRNGGKERSRVCSNCSGESHERTGPSIAQRGPPRRGANPASPRPRLSCPEEGENGWVRPVPLCDVNPAHMPVGEAPSWKQGKKKKVAQAWRCVGADPGTSAPA